MEVSDIFNLERFVLAQKRDDAYADALREVGEGRKRTHWIWYVFPQMKGLGFSPMSDYFGITSLLEARAYLGHPVLGHNLRRISEVLYDKVFAGKTAVGIFGETDALKVRSCMTLFDAVEPDNIFNRNLSKLYGGQRCERTVEMIREEYELYRSPVRKYFGEASVDEFFLNDCHLSTRGRAVHLFRIVSDGGSAEALLKAYLWRNRFDEDTVRNAGDQLGSYLKDFCAGAGLRYADKSLKEYYHALAQKPLPENPFEMARKFDSVTAETLQDPLKKQALKNYIDAY